MEGELLPTKALAKASMKAITLLLIHLDIVTPVVCSSLLAVRQYLHTSRDAQFSSEETTRETDPSFHYQICQKETERTSSTTHQCAVVSFPDHGSSLWQGSTC
jgi:hypothetical protein